jgi:hypothetical protein
MFNETMWHAEKQTFRAVTGGAYNIPGAYGIQVYGAVFPAIGTIPISNPTSGTIISQGVAVRGTNTRFTTELSEDDHIHAKNVVRKISQIMSDTLLFLTAGFPTDITVASSYRVCKPQTYKGIIARSTGSANATLQESIFVPNDVFVNGGAPISYDATAGQISFEVSR